MVDGLIQSDTSDQHDERRLNNFHLLRLRLRFETTFLLTALIYTKFCLR